MKSTFHLKPPGTNLSSLLTMCALLGAGVPAQAQTALSFDGVNDLLLIGGTPLQVPWTAEFWVKREEAIDNSAVLLGDAVTALKLEQYENTRQVGFTRFGVKDYSFNYVAPTGTWVHLAFVGSTDTRLYVDGVLQGIDPATIPLPLRQIGGDIDNRYSNHLRGTVDEVRIWSLARNENEIQANMNRSMTGSEPGLVAYWRFEEAGGATATDSSGHGRTATLINGTARAPSTPPVPTPLLIICPSNITVACSNVPSPDSGSVQVSMGCSGVTVTHGGDFAVPNPSGRTIMRYYHAYDSCGNASFCTQTITVLGHLPMNVEVSGAYGGEVEGGQRFHYLAFEAGGTPPFQFEWVFSDGFVTNTTTSTLTRIFGPFDQISGGVDVTVRNQCGSDSNHIYFFETPPPIFLSRGVVRSRTGTSGSGLGPSCPAFLTSCGSFGTSARWFKMGLEHRGTATITTQGSNYDTMLAVYTGSILDLCHLVLVACNDDISAANKQSRVRFQAAPFVPYWLVVAGNNVGTLRLTYGIEPSIDSFRILPNRSFELRSVNVPPLPYRFLGSTDLQTWQTLFSTNLLTAGDLYFLDSMAPEFRHRFYRLEW